MPADQQQRCCRWAPNGWPLTDTEYGTLRLLQPSAALKALAERWPMCVPIGCLRFDSTDAGCRLLGSPELLATADKVQTQALPSSCSAPCGRQHCSSDRLTIRLHGPHESAARQLCHSSLPEQVYRAWSQNDGGVPGNVDTLLPPPGRPSLVATPPTPFSSWHALLIYRAERVSDDLRCRCWVRPYAWAGG